MSILDASRELKIQHVARALSNETEFGIQDIDAMINLLFLLSWSRGSSTSVIRYLKDARKEIEETELSERENYTKGLHA